MPCGAATMGSALQSGVASGPTRCGPNLMDRMRGPATVVAMRTRIAAMPLFWRVFATNAFVLALAVALLALAPVTVSIPVALTELLVLLAGMVAMLILNLLLLRPAFRPLHALAATMR